MKIFSKLPALGIQHVLVFLYFLVWGIPQIPYGFSAGLILVLLSPLFIGVIVVSGIWGIVDLIKQKNINSGLGFKDKPYLFFFVFGIVLVSVSYLSWYAYDHKKFDDIVWKNTRVSLDYGDNFMTLRKRMINDLTTNVLPGLHKSDVEALLGNPAQDWIPEEGGTNFIYIIGPERGLWGPDRECLLIHFDETDIFENYKTFGNCF